MGQQQLLLVILVTIIVGIATVVAINIFGTAADNANQDAVRQDLLSAASAAQGIYARPVMMGGIGGDFAHENFGDIRRLNIPRGSSADMDYEEDEIENDNGTYTMAVSDGALTITGIPNSAPEGSIAVTITWEEDERRWDFVWDEDL